MSEINLFGGENDFSSENQNLVNDTEQSVDSQFGGYTSFSESQEFSNDSDGAENDDSLTDEAKRLVAVMNYEGMNLSQFAQALGIKISTLSHLVNGRNRPSLDIMQRALRSFAYLTADWLILGRGEQPFGVSKVDDTANEIAFEARQEHNPESGDIENKNKNKNSGLKGNDADLESNAANSDAERNENCINKDGKGEENDYTVVGKNVSNDVKNRVSRDNVAAYIDEVVNRVVETLRNQMVDKLDYGAETQQPGNVRPQASDIEQVSDMEKVPVQMLASQESGERRAEIHERVKPMVTKIIVFYSDNTFEQFTK